MSSREKFAELTAVIILMISVFIFRFVSLSLPEKSTLLEVTMSSKTDGVVQIFYNLGEGYSETDSSKANVIASEKSQRVHFELPDETIQSIRFDPINKTGITTIKKLKLVTPSGVKIKPIDLGAITVMRNCDIKTDNSGITLNPHNEDPQLAMDLAQIQERSYSNTVYVPAAFMMALMAGIFFIVLSAATYFLLQKSFVSVLANLPRYVINNLYLINRPEKS